MVDAGVSTAILTFTKTNSGGTDFVWFYDLESDGWSLDDRRTPLLPDDYEVQGFIYGVHTGKLIVDRGRATKGAGPSTPRRSPRPGPAHRPAARPAASRAAARSWLRASSCDAEPASCSWNSRTRASAVLHGVWLLLFSVFFVNSLLVTVGSIVGNLLLVQAAGRERETALRVALGAGRLSATGS